MLYSWLTTWSVNLLQWARNICATEPDSKNKGLARSCAKTLPSTGKQRAIPRPWWATVNIYSNLQCSLVKRTKYAVWTARLYFVFLSLKSAALFILSLKLERYSFKHVNIGTSACQGAISGWKLFFHWWDAYPKLQLKHIVTSHLLGETVAVPTTRIKRKKVFKIIGILKAVRFSTEEWLHVHRTSYFTQRGWQSLEFCAKSLTVVFKT